MNDKFILFIVLVITFFIGAGTAIIVSSNVPILELPQTWQGPQEQFSPGDTITEQDIRVYSNGVYVDLPMTTDDQWQLQLDLEGASWSTFTDTNSMDPLFDVGANTVRIPVPAETLQVGDIISYQYGEDIIIHRIVHIDNDESGLYFILKGDNNPTSDPGKVRPEQILGKVVAIFY